MLATLLASTGCSHAAQAKDGYRTQAVPGITHARVLEILGKPQEDAPFSLPGVATEVMTYPFGQVLLQHGVAVAVSINNDPNFRGPFGVTIGMSEDDLHAAIAAHPKRRTGHKESYDAVEQTVDTRTKDLYDATDNVMIELTAANANDPLAPFNIAQVTLTNDAGARLIDAFTKARVDGLYPDVHVYNFTSEDWQGKN